ncbi:hypothetical protein Anas_10985 [Armadillidium nasatum]|uniref:Uncharacterized protein n=1 Tax=Armadillidium nasatum TaxID=96803 RepID=A0A5N5SWC4_9CRUS|nr:hypothetical protein Anas_10985 [Armadillidium nasatum]
MLLMIANNPLSVWESVGELDKLQSLEELVLGHEHISGRGNYALEFTFGRIRTLKMLNRTHVNPREKRDYQIFYLRSFSGDYYSNGGTENPEEAKLSEEFIKKHPSYLAVVRIHGIPSR